MSNLRTNLALKMAARIFLVVILLGFLAICFNLPTVVTSAWYVHHFLFVLSIGLLFGLLAFFAACFVDYLTEQETIERLKIFFKKPSVGGFVAVIIYGFIIGRWFWPTTNADANTTVADYTWPRLGIIFMGIAIYFGVVGIIHIIQDYKIHKNNAHKINNGGNR